MRDHFPFFVFLPSESSDTDVSRYGMSHLRPQSSRFVSFHSFAMFGRQFFVKQLSLFRRWSSSKSYICDRSTIEVYGNNDQFKEIVDRQEHHFLYHHDAQLKAPAVFKAIPRRFFPTCQCSKAYRVTLLSHTAGTAIELLFQSFVHR